MSWHIFDAHTHVKDQRQWRMMKAGQNFSALASAGTPEEAERLDKIAKKDKNLLYSCGIHPWHADRYDAAQIKPWLVGAVAMGEIGMDSVWCAIDLAIQRRVFFRQIEMARDAGKPIILHTKGCEGEIAKMIKGVGVPVIVHWYASPDDLDQYLDQNCYFTVGPNFRTEEAIKGLIHKVPVTHLLVETDGLSGLEWAMDAPVQAGDVFGILKRNICDIAAIKGVEADALGRQMMETAQRLFPVEFGQSH